MVFGVSLVPRTNPKGRLLKRSGGRPVGLGANAQEILVGIEDANAQHRHLRRSLQIPSGQKAAQVGGQKEKLRGPEVAVGPIFSFYQ